MTARLALSRRFIATTLLVAFIADATNALMIRFPHRTVSQALHCLSCRADANSNDLSEIVKRPSLARLVKFTDVDSPLVSSSLSENDDAQPLEYHADIALPLAENPPTSLSLHQLCALLI